LQEIKAPGGESAARGYMAPKIDGIRLGETGRASEMLALLRLKLTLAAPPDNSFCV
jgi:hypothetical protein